MRKKRKNIIATTTGIALIDTIQNELLKSAELTGDWERKIRLIEKGEYQLDVFKTELNTMVRSLTDEVIFNTPSSVQFFQEPKKIVKEKTKRTKKEYSFEDIDCPKCKVAKLAKGKAAIGCKDFGTCGFKVPFILMGKKLTSAQLTDLVSKSKTKTIKGFIRPSDGEKLQGKFFLNDNFNVSFEQG